MKKLRLFSQGRCTRKPENRKGRGMRLTIPRRVYTDRQMEVVVDALARIWERRDQIRGLEFTYEPKVLRHFLCRLKPIEK